MHLLLIWHNMITQVFKVLKMHSQIQLIPLLDFSKSLDSINTAIQEDQYKTRNRMYKPDNYRCHQHNLNIVNRRKTHCIYSIDFPYSLYNILNHLFRQYQNSRSCLRQSFMFHHFTTISIDYQWIDMQCN